LVLSSLLLVGSMNTTREIRRGCKREAQTRFGCGAMNREQEIRKEIKSICQKIGTELTGYQIVLFGSRAADTAQERSDYDVGVLGQQSLPLRVFYEIQDLLDGIETLYSIDWVDLNETTEQFRHEAMKTIEVLYE